MKLHTERHDIERGGVQAEAEFKIKTTAKAFDILSSGLYTDPITAIVRELSCNAWDSHVEAGKENEPFELHLPNRLEPWFSVKDNGIGLDHDEVMNLYTTYFDSTKTHSNEFIGALGLGSKSPFAYTKAFEVIARHDGKQRIYSAFINEDAVPTIAKLGEIDTDECNGVEVKLTIQSGDHYKFNKAAKIVLKWFPNKPTVFGDPYFEFEELPEAHQKGDGWIMHKKSWSDNFFTAVQGNVAYKCDLNQLDDLDDGEKGILRRNQVTAFFNIGDLEVAASREEIRYDKRSKQALVKRLGQILEMVREDIRKVADQHKDCFWDAIIALDQMSNNLFGERRTLRNFMKKSDHPVIARYVVQNGELEIDDLHAHEVTKYEVSRWGGSRMSRYDVTSHLSPKDETAVFINDLRLGGVARIREYLNNTGGVYSVVAIKTVKDPVKFVKTNDPKEPLKAVPMTEKEIEDEYKQLIDDLGDPKLLTVSTDTPKPKRESLGRGVPVYRFDSVYSSASNHWGDPDKVRWTRLVPKDIDLSKGGLYFFMRFGTHITEIKADGTEHEMNWKALEVQKNLSLIVDIANRYGGFDEEFTMDDIIGLGAQARKQIEKLDNWYNVFDLIRDVTPKYTDPVRYLKNVQVTSDILNIKNAMEHDVFAEHVRDLSKDSRFRKAVLPMIEDFEASDKGKKKRLALDQARFVKWFDHRHGAGVFDEMGKPYFENKDFDIYPMALTFVKDIELDNSYRTTDLDVLFDYIDTIDRSRK